MRTKHADVVALLSLLICGFVPPSEARAQAGGEPAEGALFLLLPVGAQGVALGRAMTWVDGVESVWWNPAGLAGLTRSQGVVVRGDHTVGTATAATVLYAREDLGALGASYYLLDAGEFDQTDDSGNYIGTLTVRNHLGIVSGATHVTDRVAVGANLKLVRYQFSCRGLCTVEGTTATTWAVDLGAQLEPVSNLRVGALVAHLGPRLQVKNADQADPLPARVRVAWAYDLVNALVGREDLQGWIAMEVEDRLRDPGATSFYLGTELRAGRTDVLALRAGHAWSEVNQEDGTRVGLGLRYQRFDLAIAKSLAVSTITGETEPVHVTFAIGF